jgi:hypothetical protein
MRDDFGETSEEKSVTNWYLARDGQQCGPISYVEMKKFNELGYLRATGLVWRKEFPDWRPAAAVFEIASREKG